MITDNSPANPVLAEVVRSGFAESRHRGAFVALNSDGDIAFSQGDVNAPFFPRSSNKPFQALAMTRLGLTLKDELLALAAASHSGEDFHVDGVSKILHAADLTEADLRCPVSWPLHAETMHRLIAEGKGESRIRMNCSGKHAAMLATCVRNGWPTATYLDPGHPLQAAIKATMEELCGEAVAATGVDGCGAPLFAVSLVGLARGFRALVKSEVADAMRANPAWVSGTDRDENHLMTATPGLLLKGGAEAVAGFALLDGRAAALKIDDGTSRARMPVTVAVLRQLGVPVPAELATVPLYGGGEVVGEVRAT